MKIRITDMPVRINGERFYPGMEIEVSEEMYKSMKSSCIIIDEDIPVVTNDPVDDKEVEVKELTEDQKIMGTTDYKTKSKDEIMLELAENGIEFDPNMSKVELYKMLGSD